MIHPLMSAERNKDTSFCSTSPPQTSKEDDPRMIRNLAGNSPSSVLTLEPYTPSASKGKFKKSKHELLPGVFVPNSFDKYLTLNIATTECDIFDIHRDLVKCCGRDPKISPSGPGKLIVESASPEECEKLKSLSSLGGFRWSAHPMSP